jgi:hypothetical protein
MNLQENVTKNKELSNKITLLENNISNELKKITLEKKTIE